MAITSARSLRDLLLQLSEAPWLPEDFLSLEMPCTVNTSGVRRIHRRGFQKHISGEISREDLALRALLDGPLCTRCWAGLGFGKWIREAATPRYGSRTTTANAIAGAAAFLEWANGFAVLAERFGADPVLAPRAWQPGRPIQHSIEDLERARWTLAHLVRNHEAACPWMAEAALPYEVAIGAMTQRLAAEDDGNLRRWAKEQLGSPELNDSSWVDEAPTVLVGMRSRSSGREYSALRAMLHPFELHTGEERSLAVILPRYICDALLLQAAQVFDDEGYLRTLPVTDPTPVLETAAALWEPGTDGPLSDFATALSAARAVTREPQSAK